jgi:Omp85 superfamily domain
MGHRSWVIAQSLPTTATPKLLFQVFLANLLWLGSEIGRSRNSIAGVSMRPHSHQGSEYMNPQKLPVFAISRSAAMQGTSVALLVAAPNWAMAAPLKSPLTPVSTPIVVEQRVSQRPTSRRDDRSQNSESIPKISVPEAGTVDLHLQQLQGQNLDSEPFSTETPSFWNHPENRRLVQIHSSELEFVGPGQLSTYRGPFSIEKLPVLTPSQLEEQEVGFYFDLTGDRSRDKRFYAHTTLGVRGWEGNAVQLELEGGERTLGFDLSYIQSAITGEDGRIGYQISAFNQRSPDNVFLVDNGDEDLEEIFLPRGDEQVPWVHRLGGRFRLFVPASEHLVLVPGITYQRVSVRNRAFTDRTFSQDEEGNRFTVSDMGSDDLLTLSLFAQLGAVERDEDEIIVQGTRAQVGTEQAIPIGDGDISFNRLTGGIVQYVPADLFGFAEGPRTLVFSGLAGATLGDLPPYEGFSLGGYSSVRGYGRGDVGTGSRFVQLGAEYRFPIANLDSDWFSRLRGVMFVDFASDLGSDDDVIGEPARVRNKPGDGFGFGVGLRLGGIPRVDVLRIDYALTDQGDGAIYFGVGERF